MWHEIIDIKEVKEFMEAVGYFHDGCIKEMKYISGAYVADNLAMYPINDRRVLSVIIQRQFDNPSMVELEFIGLKYMKLFPTPEGYTCEIMGSTMLLKDDNIYWCDLGGLSENELDDYDGTLICASKLRWRSGENCMGEKDFYIPVK